MPVRALSPELAEKARVELNEDPKRLEDDLQHLKDWLAKQKHLRVRTDDQWLVAFLRGCKFSLERAKEKLDLYYTIRTTAPDFFNKRFNDPRFNEILDLGAVIILPKTFAPDAPSVTIIRPGAYDPDKYHISEIVATSNELQKVILMENDNCTVAGSLAILDLENVNMGHFLQMTPTVMKKMVVASQDAMPIRMKGSHYINTPNGFETIFNTMKALLNEKNRQRLYVHNKNYDELYKHIPREVLPIEYGGNAGTIKDILDNWKLRVQEYSAWLEEDVSCGSDETKRPGKPKTAETMFGMEGSFRKLDFD